MLSSATCFIFCCHIPSCNCRHSHCQPLLPPTVVHCPQAVLSPAAAHLYLFWQLLVVASSAKHQKCKARWHWWNIKRTKRTEAVARRRRMTRVQTAAEACVHSADPSHLTCLRLSMVHPSRKVGLIRALFDCHQYCRIICVLKLIAEFNLFHFHI